jgi:hypothetical protein
MNKNTEQIFSGNVYFFCSFDVGDDIDLRTIHSKYSFARTGTFQSHYFKSYHKPLILDHKKCFVSEECESIRLYNFGVISLLYCFPFNTTLENLKKSINQFDQLAQNKSYIDVKKIFHSIESEIKHARFFHLQKFYTLMQINPLENLSPISFKENHGNEIAAVLRFENERLSDFKQDEILEEAFGYYRGDLLIIDFESALAYDNDYHDILEIFEFANMRHMELQFFDRALDKQLNYVYENEVYKIPFKAYFPIFGMFSFDPIGELAKLRVDISVVSERLWSSIKFSEEPYYVEIYNMLAKKLDFQNWQDSIDRKLEVIRHILEVHQNRVSAIRYDFLNILIILLIFLEFVIGIMNYHK